MICFFGSFRADRFWFAWYLRLVFLKDTRQPFEVSLIQCLNTRYGFPKHSIFFLYGVTCPISLACGPRIASSFLSFPCGSFSNFKWKLVLRVLSDWFEKIVLALLSPLSWYWIEAYSLHKTELNYRSLDRVRWQKCTKFAPGKLLLLLNSKEL